MKDEERDIMHITFAPSYGMPKDKLRRPTAWGKLQWKNRTFTYKQ